MAIYECVFAPFRVTSPIDGRSLEGVSSVKVQQESVFESDGRTIVCTEVWPSHRNRMVIIVNVLGV